jgi:two-component system OmpR family response regulator
MRVLLVEDDATIADFIARGLGEAGFVVDAARDGDSGMELALARAYDAAVMDLMLPGRDGLRVIEDLRRRGWKVPVLILSARRSVEDRVKGRASIARTCPSTCSRARCAAAAGYSSCARASSRSSST